MDNYYKRELYLFDLEKSVLMSEYLEREGYGVLERRENKRTQLIGQLAELRCISAKSIATGGQAEGSALLKDSDSDIIEVMQGVRVSEDYNFPSSDCIEDGMVYICIKRSKEFPGFCKLELSQTNYGRFRNDLLLKRTIPYLKQITASVVKQGEKLFISSKLMMENLPVTGLLPPDNPNKPLYEVTGPAIRNSSVDYVRSIEFNKWPREAKVWKERQRKHNWPSRKVLERLEKEVSCYVVPKGNKSSVDFEVEWNISFVEIERELIWDMNDTQFKCYICLKKLKKGILEENCPCFQEISTYQVKNIMFWLCENFPEHEWKTENLFKYVRLGLIKLQKCIWLSYNAHYFIPGMNLWQNVKLSVLERSKALICLSEFKDTQCIVNNLLDFSKRLTSVRNVRFISTIRAYDKRCNILMDYGAVCLKERCFEHLHKEMLSNFPETKIFSPCVTITKAKIRLRQLPLHTNCSRRFDKDDHAAISEIVAEIRAGCKTDYLTTSLNIALVFNFFGLHSDVKKELKSKLSNNTRKLHLYENVSCHLLLNSAEVYRVYEDVSQSSKDKQNVILEFYVRWSEIKMLPFPLKLQRFLLGTRALFKVFPVDLAYYLLFTSEHYLMLKSESEATRKLLVSSVLNRKRILEIVDPFYYFHLYLIGYSFYVTGDMKEAYNWFARSAIENPSRINAALYQIAIMINDVIKKICHKIADT